MHVATIQTAIRLTDMMTSPLMNITQALNMTISAFESVESSADGAINGMNFDGVRERINDANMELNETIESIRRNTEEQENFNDSLKNGVNHSNSLLSTVKKMAAAYLSIQTARKALDLADTMSQTSAKLSMIVDDGGSVQELEDKIFASAQRSRASYQSTADMISKLGMQAGSAFKSNDELIAFTEQLNKSFVTAGTDAQGVASTMYNLTQALASGVLRGQDLNAVMSNAMPIVQNIADYLGVSVGQIRDMAAEGQLTAEVVKNAMLAASNETNALFEQMPMTFGQVWTSISNKALRAFEPILSKLSEIANSDRFNQLVDGVTSAMILVAGIVIEIFELVGAVGGFMYDNWSIIAPIVYGVATALGIYAGYLVVTNAIELISKGIKIASAIASYFHAAATGTQATATAAATAAQYGLNTALLASPITWVLIIIIAIIAAIYGVVAAINKVTGSTISATGIIFGAFATLGAFLWNLFLGLLELVLGVINNMINPFIKIANFIGNVFTSPISSIIYLFQGMADGVLAILQKIASAMDFIFGSNMADTVAGWRSGLKDMADAAVAKYAPNENYQNVMDELDLNVESLGLKRWAYGDAWDAGYAAGENLEDAIANFDPANLFNVNMPDANDYTGSYDPSQYLSGIADDTGKIAGSVEISGEQLKYLRDIAERDVVNRFTTAELTVNFSSDIKAANSEVDLDGVVSYLEEKVNETLEMVAEGVHK